MRAIRLRSVMLPVSLKNNAELNERHSATEHPEFGTFDEIRAKALIEKYGLRAPKRVVLLPEDPEFDQINELSFPLVMKILSSDIPHKSDGGFVVLSLETGRDVQVAFQAMKDKASMIGASVHGYLIEEMAPRGIEVVVGGVTDKSFGPMIMFGLGGIYVEVFRDITFRICPISKVDAEEMIDGLMSKPILEGVRGGIVADRKKLVDLLLRIGGEQGLLMSEQGVVNELDLNPVIVNSDSLTVVDARVVAKTS